MMRALWFLLVPGLLPVALVWLGFAALNTFVEPRPPVAVFDAVLFLLNLASWDYQRRHRAGGAS